MGKIEKLFFVDVETMGTDDETDQIIEIGAAVCLLLPNQMVRIESTYHALIKPMHPAVNGILPVGVFPYQTKLHYPELFGRNASPDVVWDIPEFHKKQFASANWILAKPLDEALDSFLTYWRCNKEASWIGQNPDFDLRFLKRDARLCGFRWPTHPEVDYHTFDVSSRMLPLVLRGELPGVGLKHSRVWAQVPGEQSHRAMGDIHDEIAVWNALTLYEAGCPVRYIRQEELEGDGWQKAMHILPDYDPGPCSGMGKARLDL